MSAPSSHTVVPSQLPLGLTGWLIRFSDRLDDAANQAALAFHAAARQHFKGTLSNSSLALASCYLTFDPARISRAEAQVQVSELLASRDWTTAAPPEGRQRWTLPACFDPEHAPQLAQAADLAECSVDSAIAEICAADLRVMALGFAPGQPYLGTLPERWALPRQTSLTEQVPAGALALAVRQITLFANPAPTGWRHVATTPFRPFQPDAAAPFPLNPGDHLTLTPITRADYEALLRTGDPMGGARAEPLP